MAGLRERQKADRERRILEAATGLFREVGYDAARIEDIAERALTIDRNFAETHGGLAVIAVLEGDGAAAAACIKRALRLQPGCLSARYAEVLALGRAGKHEAAQAAFEALMSTRIADEEGSYRSFVAAHLRSLRADPATANMFGTRH